MKLVYPQIKEIFDFDKYPVQTLVIENPMFMYQLLSDINRQLNGESGDAVLSENDRPVPMKKRLDLVIDFINFDVNSRGIMTKIMTELDKMANEDENREKTEKLLAGIESYIDDLCFELNADIYCEKLSFFQILKAVGLKVSSDFENLADAIYAYMELVREFEGEKLFVFVNLKSYVLEEDINSLIATAQKHEFQVLLLDNNNSFCINSDKNLIIDRDLCEI